MGVLNMNVQAKETSSKIPKIRNDYGEQIENLQGEKALGGRVGVEKIIRIALL